MNFGYEVNFRTTRSDSNKEKSFQSNTGFRLLSLHSLLFPAIIELADIDQVATVVSCQLAFCMEASKKEL